MPNNTTLYVVGAAILVGILIISNANASPDSSSSDNSGAADMVSQSQLQITASNEGFSATAYPDGSNSSGQLYSIGYGHQIQPSETNLLTATITQAQGLQMLLNDMQPVVDYLNGTGIAFTQGQYDALCDFGYNAGIGALTNIVNVYQTQGADAVPGAMQAYVYWHPTPGGAAVLNQTLVTRRAQEVATWNS